MVPGSPLTSSDMLGWVYVHKGTGTSYTSGWYHPSNETWKTDKANLVLDSGQ